MTNFAELIELAEAAGNTAAEVTVPRPMTVVGFGTITEGVCGYAWINVRGNTAFGRYVAANGWRKDSYYGGRTRWVHEFDQSYERKIAYASAYARVLEANGVPAVAAGRID